MQIISILITYLETIAAKTPLELFSLLGAFIEELIAPIPSPFVMTLAGSITKAHAKPLVYLLVVAAIGAFGKTLAGWILYFITDKAEDLVLTKFGKFFGVTHESVEKIGKYFSGGKKDAIALAILRSVPIMPSSPISIVCGFIKINIKVFIIFTFLGSIVRNMFFLYLGYTGLAASESMMEGIDSLETIGKLVFLGIAGTGLIIAYKKRDKWMNGNSHEKNLVDTLSYKKVDPLPKEESDTKPTLYIFRHGQSEDNANFVFSGWRDSPLTEKGREQARVLAEKIKDKKFDVLISSPQKRAIETMEMAVSLNENAKNKEIERDDRIKERSYGDLQGQSKKEYGLKDPEGLQKIRRSFKGMPPNGESIEIVCKRVAEFCDDIVERMKKEKVNVAVSCHGNSIRGFRKYFENLPDDETAHIETPLGKDYAAYVID